MPPPHHSSLSDPIASSMADQPRQQHPKLLYIVVVDGDGGSGRNGAAGEYSSSSLSPSPSSSFRYTRSVLHSTLQLMGCKPRHAFKISRRVFDEMRGEHAEAARHPNHEVADMSSPRQFELYKTQTTVVVARDRFLDVVCDALSAYKYVGPNQRADCLLACRIRERKESVTILLCGTSGCGKSTLSTLLGSRLGITTVVSTDSIRHMMRSFVDEKQNPLLWASTYHAGECLDPVAVAQAKARRKAKKRSVVSSSSRKTNEIGGVPNDKSDGRLSDLAPGLKLIGKKQMAIEGYKAQSEMVIDSLDRLITAWEDRKESVVVEGVHLSLNFVMGLMRKHPSIIPFMIYITNEDKHMERFAVRAKYMTLDPTKNKYVKYISNIRTIQEYLCTRADKYLVPKINNTNVDRTVAAIHATVFSCLRRRAAGDQLYDPTTNTVSVIDEEYRNQCAANSVSSKRMFKLIQRLGSSRNLMAILNIDGSVSKAWPVESGGSDGKSSSGNGGEKPVGNPIYGPLNIGRAEPVNLRFGSFGISAWPSDTGCTSHAGSVDDSWADATEAGSRHVPSSSSSPKMSDGPSKEIKESSASGSEEEADVPPEAESDEDLSDVEKREIHEDMEGSVDEDSTRSDEEYEDLAMRDGIENGYLTDDDKDQTSSIKSSSNKFLNSNQGGHVASRKYQENLDVFLKTDACVPETAGPSVLPASMSSKRNRGKKWKRSLSDSLQSQINSVPALSKSVSLYRRNSAVSVAPQGLVHLNM